MRISAVFSSQILSTCYGAGVLTVTAFLLGRLLGPRDYGTYMFVLTVVALYGIVLEGGFKTLIFKERARSAGTAEILSRATWHLVLFFLLGLIPLQLFLRDMMLGFFALAYYALVVLSDFVLFDMKGGGYFVAEARWRAFQKTLAVAPLWVLMMTPWLSPLNVFLTSALGYGAWLAVICCCRSVRLRPRIGFSGNLYRRVLPFVLINICTLLYFRSDLVMLQYLAGSREVGLYSAAYKFIEGICFVLAPVSHVYFQRLCKCSESRAASRALLVRYLSGYAVLAAVIAALGLSLAKQLLTFTYGADFLAALPAFSVLIGALLVIIPNAILMQTAIAYDQEKMYSLFVALGAALNIVLNLFLIPLYGIVGAAAATLITESALLVCLALLIWNKQRRWNWADRDNTV
ncbi:MAG: oligosaccharide flippase family protein [Deltaproteobacteria bacterium]|nr:oligosaccharide flippase family protein [Deltaproteobacteria bacterium]